MLDRIKKYFTPSQEREMSEKEMTREQREEKIKRELEAQWADDRCCKTWADEDTHCKFCPKYKVSEESD